MIDRKKSHDKINNGYKGKFSDKLLTNNGNMKNQNFNENKQQNDFTTAEAAWMEKKQKLYKDANNQPLWDFRKIQINPTDVDELVSFPTNKITSNKYGTYSFLFKSIYEQFLRLPNIWFLLISLLEFMPALQNLTNYMYYSKHYSIYLLICFICVSIIKNVYEDSRRSNIDSQINNRLCHIVDGSNNQLKAVRWMDLTVGTIIRLIENEQVPADILLLSCNNNEGLVYIGTSLINGETNLNKKCCVKETRNETSIYGICHIKGRIICEKPNSNMESFNGSLKLDAHPRATSLSINNVVFKGSYIKNTDYIFGVIIYTGIDTKMMKNIFKNTYKSGYVNKELNTYTIFTLLFSLIVVFISVLCKWTEDEKFKNGTHFLLITEKDSLFESIIKYILLYANIIPISILITIDLISILQSMLIENDNRISTFENDLSEYSIMDENDEYDTLSIIKSCNFFRKYTYFLNNFSRRNFTKNKIAAANTDANSENRKSFISTFDKLRVLKSYFHNRNSLMSTKANSNAVYNRSSIAESDNIQQKNVDTTYNFTKEKNVLLKKNKSINFETNISRNHISYNKYVKSASSAMVSNREYIMRDKYSVNLSNKGLQRAVGTNYRIDGRTPYLTDDVTDGISEIGPYAPSNYSNNNKGILVNNKNTTKDGRNIFHTLFPFLQKGKKGIKTTYSAKKVDKTKNIGKCYFPDARFVSNDDEYGWGICLNSNMHGDLGNVDFIFTDKTGTLTNNSMSFNMCSIGGRTYGERRMSKKEKSRKGKDVNQNPMYFYDSDNNDINSVYNNNSVYNSHGDHDNSNHGNGNSFYKKRKSEDVFAKKISFAANVYNESFSECGKAQESKSKKKNRHFSRGNTTCEYQPHYTCEKDNIQSIDHNNLDEESNVFPNYKSSYFWHYRSKSVNRKNSGNSLKKSSTLRNSSRFSSSLSSMSSSCSSSLTSSSCLSSDSYSQSSAYSSDISNSFNSSFMYSSSNNDKYEMNNDLDNTRSYSELREEKNDKNHLQDETKNDDIDKDKCNDNEKYPNQSRYGFYFFDKNYQNYLMQQKCCRPKKFRINMNPESIKSRCDFKDKRIYEDLNSDTWRGYYIDEFFKCITLCHAVVPFIQFDFIRNKNLSHYASRSSKGASQYQERYNNTPKGSSNDVVKSKNESNVQTSIDYDCEEELDDEDLEDKDGGSKLEKCQKKWTYENLENAKGRTSSNANQTVVNTKKRSELNLYNYNTMKNLKGKNEKTRNNIKFKFLFSKNYRKNKKSFTSRISSETFKGVEKKHSNRWNRYLHMKKSKNLLSNEKNSRKSESVYISNRISVVSFKQISKEKLLTLSSSSSIQNSNGRNGRGGGGEKKCKTKTCNLKERSTEVTSFFTEKGDFNNATNTNNPSYDERRISKKLEERNTIHQSYFDLDKCRDIKMGDNYTSESYTYWDAIKYQSSSLDEECLIYTSNYIGYRLILRNQNTMCVEIDGNLHKWTIIGVNEFTNKRGRMSVVVKPEYMQSGSILYVKGSDTSILSLLNLKYSKFLEKKKKKRKRRKQNSEKRTTKVNQSNNDGIKQRKGDKLYTNNEKRDNEEQHKNNEDCDNPQSEFCNQSVCYKNENMGYSYSEQYDANSEHPGGDINDIHLYPEYNMKNSNWKYIERYRHLEKQLRKFSVKGLRTMVFAFKYLNEHETAKYKKMYDDARMSIYNKEERLEKVAETVETDLTYLGITGVKDRLQKNVSKTIEILSQSGIRIWMLTGDNVEYSLHISFLCKFLNSHTKIFHAMLENTNYKKLKREGKALYELFQLEKEDKKPHEKLCLLINGKNLQNFLNHTDLQTHFLNMACTSDVVIACRITARQKAFLVQLIKHRLTPTPNTLAIGDGANDIAMLQEANIGVSIMTPDCIISAGYSDYCIKKFCYLRKLLLIYGSKHLYTISIILYWNFFKNIILILPVFFYQAYASWSCVKIYPELLYTFFNIFWIFIPIIYYIFLQHNLNYDILYNIPLFYALSRRKYNMSMLKFFPWVIEAIFYSVIVFFFAYTALKENSHLSNGEVVTISTFGNICFLGCFLISILRLFMEGSLWSPSILITCLGFCLFVFFPSIVFISFAYLSNDYIREVFRQTFLWTPLYILLILWFTTCIICYIFINFIKAAMFPDIYNVVNHWLFEQYQEKRNKHKYVYFLSKQKKFLNLKKFGRKIKHRFKKLVCKKYKFNSSTNDLNREQKLKGNVKNYLNKQPNMDISYLSSKAFNKSLDSKFDHHAYETNVDSLDYNDDTHFDEEKSYAGARVSLCEQTIHGMEYFSQSEDDEYEKQGYREDRRNMINGHNKNSVDNPNELEIKETQYKRHEQSEGEEKINTWKQAKEIGKFRLKEKNKSEYETMGDAPKNRKGQIEEYKASKEDPKKDPKKDSNNEMVNKLGKGNATRAEKVDVFQKKSKKENLVTSNTGKNEIMFKNIRKESTHSYKEHGNENKDKKDVIIKNGKIKNVERDLSSSNIMDYKNEPTCNSTVISEHNDQMEDSELLYSPSDEYAESSVSRIDESLMSEMKNCLNPLKNTFLVDLLPQGKRFQINEDHVFFKNNEKMEHIPEPLDVNKRNYHIIQNNAEFYDNESTSEFSYTSTDSLNDYNDKKKKQNENSQKEIVKVSSLINRFTLAFKDMQLESGFQVHKKNKFYKIFTPWYRFIFILLGIFFLYIWKLESSLRKYWNVSSNASTDLFVLILSLLLELVLIAATVTTFLQKIFIENFNKIISAVVIIIITHHVVTYSITHIDGVFQAVLFPLYTFVILRLPFVNAVLCNIIFLSLFIIRFEGDHFLDKKGLAHYIPLFIGVDVFVGFVGYRLEYNQRKNFLLEYSVESSRRKQREILNTMLPPFVVDEMIYSELNEEGIPTSLKAEDIETVTVIFCDIYEFQNIVASIEPTRLVEVLDRLFLCFDKCTEQFNCTKIETVFETYLAACGLVKKEGNDSKENNGQQDAHDSIDFALSILQVSSHIKYEKTKHMFKESNSYDNGLGDNIYEKKKSMGNTYKGETIELEEGLNAETGIGVNVLSGSKDTESRPTRIRVKIGINSGRIIAGVVGSKKPQYALFGDTVNTASRMKTTGKPDYIHISEATYNLVKDDKTLIYEKKETEIKGKGNMTTYLLTSVIGLNYPFLGDALDEKNHFLSEFYADSNEISNNISLDPKQNILGCYSNQINQNNEYTINDTIYNDEKSFNNSDNDTNKDYVNLKDLSLHDLPTEHIRDVNTHYYEIIKLRNLKIGTAVGHQLKHKDIFNMTFLNNGMNNETTTNFNPYIESSKDLDDIKELDVKMNKLSLSDSLYYLNENLIKKDQENDNHHPIKSDTQELTEHHSKQHMRNTMMQFNKEFQNSNEDDYKNIELCTSKCNSCGDNYCIPNNCINYDHVNHVSYHKMLSNIRKNYLKNIRNDAKKDVDRNEEQGGIGLKRNLLSPSNIFSYCSKIFTFFGRKKKRERQECYSKSRKVDNYRTEQQVDEKETKSKSVMSLNREWIFLKFSDKNLEAKYRAHFYSNKSNINSIEQALIIFLVTFVMQTLISSTVSIVFVDHKLATQTLEVNYFAYWSVRSLYTYFGFILWLLFHYRTRPEVSSLLNVKWMIFFLNLLFISAACIFSIAYLWAISERDQTTSYTIWMTNDTIEFFFYLVILHHNTGMLFQTCILVDLLFITMSLTFISTSVVKTLTTDSTIMLIPWYVTFNLISTYCKESIDRRTFYANESAKKTENRATELLNDMLPKNVLDEFQQDRLKLAYTHDRLTFLFADICGFTSWANGVDASEVLTLLQKLFAKFDNDSTKYGLYKLCTIGDAYVAISEPVTEDNQDYDPVDGTERVLEMAYSMIRIIKEIREKLSIPNLNMRIGLHYGSCVGGVIGSGRLRYDLWGIDVLTGNLMESNGIPGKINVSETLKNFLLQQFKNRFIFKPHTTVRVIYKDVKSFIITDKKEIDASNNSQNLHNRGYLLNRKIKRPNHLDANLLFGGRKRSSFNSSMCNSNSFDNTQSAKKDLYYINMNDAESNF